VACNRFDGGFVEKEYTVRDHKKEYQEPVLSVYGDVLKLTGAVSNTSKHGDGGGMAHSKTH
jgi:hypothetical protein